MALMYVYELLFFKQPKPTGLPCADCLQAQINSSANKHSTSTECLMAVVKITLVVNRAAFLCTSMDL